MRLRSFRVLVLGTSLGASFAPVLGCEDPATAGELVQCAHTFTCGQNIVADNADALAAGRGVFCTDPNDPERDTLIDAYEAEFADGCDGVVVQCDGEGTPAVCAASCTVVDVCDVTTAVDVRL